jgi:hypothetical protein
LNTEEDIKRGYTFITSNGLEKRTEMFRCITMTYYMMTTLTAIGYGDMSAVSNNEKIICMFLFFFGQLFVVYTLSLFGKVLENLDEVDQFDSK